MQDLLPYLIAVLFLGIGSLWIQAYIRRYFKFIAAKEYRYIDSTTVVVIGDYLRLYLFIFAFLLSLYLLSIPSESFRELWLLFEPYIPPALGVLTTIVLATIFLQIGRRYTEYISGNLHLKPKTRVSERTAYMLGLLIKYAILIIAAAVVLVFLLTIWGRRESVFGAFVEFFTMNSIYIGMMIAIVIVVFLVDEGIGMFLEDLKTHTKTFTPQIISLVRGGLQYGLYSLAWLLIIYVLLMMIKMEAMGTIVIAIYIVLLILILAVFIATTIRHASAGIVLMAINPFNKGDTIRVGDIEGEVVESNLFVTKIKDVHEEILTIPNTKILAQTVHNFSRGKRYGISIKIEVDFAIPHKKVEETLIRAAKNTPGIVKEPEPFVRAIEIRGRKILYELVAFTTSNLDEEKIRGALINSVQDAILASDFKACFAVKGHEGDGN